MFCTCYQYICKPVGILRHPVLSVTNLKPWNERSLAFLLLQINKYSSVHICLLEYCRLSFLYSLFFKFFHKCESMPTLLEYLGVSQTPAESGLPYRWPNLLDLKESSLKYILFYLKWLIFWYFKVGMFWMFDAFLRLDQQNLTCSKVFLAWLRR